ncbi:MAG TPA: ABC transporter substrate-binding protein [Rectinemataceae bacterium]|nr:ABC transporter substrate-binding protein [Rectinemataceae bacterium]
MKHPRGFPATMALILPLALVAVFALTSAGGSGPIKIGFFAPESGFAAADGQSAYDSAKLAVDDINKAGGIDGRQVQLVNYDDASDAKQAVSIATRLVTQDKVDAVVSGSYSDQTLAAAPIFERARVPMLAAYAVNPGIPATGKYIFQQDFNGIVEGKAAAVALVKNLGATKIAIVAIKNDFGSSLVQGFTAEAQRLGATVVATDYNQFGEKDFTPILMRDQAKGANGFFMAQYYSEGQQFLNNWNTLGFDMPMVGTEGIDSTTQFFQPVGSQANGLVFTTPFDRDSSQKVVVDYIKGFTAAYGFPPDMVGATTYDSFLVLKHAMAKGLSPERIREGIAGIRNFVGVTGTIIRYNGKGEVVKAVELQIVKDGLPHHYGTVDDPAVITP